MSIFGEAATGIADELAASASASAGAWHGDRLVVEGAAAGVVRGDVGHDLYDGGAGIAWFLAHQARRSGSADQAQAARAGLAAALEASGAMVRDGSLALYGGAAGIALAADEGGRALGDYGLRYAAERLGERVAVAVCDDLPDGADLIGGKAGILAALLSLARARPRTAAVLPRAVRTLADALIAEASRGWWGAAWPEGSAPALCGLGHGASGIGWALAEAGAWLDDMAVRAAGRAALRYEAARFDASRGTWPDLRGAADGRPAGWMDAWCHGAFGIGAVRWRLWQMEPDPQLLAQAAAAMAAARRRVVEAANAAPEQAIDVTLCHGLGGAAELMLLAYEATGRAEHLAAARRVGRLILRRREEQRWAVGLPGGRDVPGLFLGRAGIGATLLRLDDPAAMPSPMLAGVGGRHYPLGSGAHLVPFGSAHPGQSCGAAQEGVDRARVHCC